MAASNRAMQRFQAASLVGEGRVQLTASIPAVSDTMPGACYSGVDIQSMVHDEQLRGVPYGPYPICKGSTYVSCTWQVRHLPVRVEQYLGDSRPQLAPAYVITVYGRSDSILI